MIVLKGDVKLLFDYLLSNMSIQKQMEVITNGCPHCSSEDLDEAYCGLQNGYPLHRITCNNCGSCLYCSDDTEISLRWNAGEHYYPEWRRYFYPGDAPVLIKEK